MLNLFDFKRINSLMQQMGKLYISWRIVKILGYDALTVNRNRTVE